MKPCKTLWCLVGVTLGLLSASLAPAQSTNAPAGQPDMAAMMALTQPGENHKILADMCGTWAVEVKFWLSPDTNTPPMTSTGTTVTTSMFGGRYFVSDNKSVMNMPGPDGKPHGMDYAGRETAAYDNVKKQFVSTWIDNMGTGIMYFIGSYDPATKALTYTSDEEEYPGMKIKVREVITLTDHDHHTMEYYQTQGGQETRAMEIKYTRTGQ